MIQAVNLAQLTPQLQIKNNIAFQGINKENLMKLSQNGNLKQKNVSFEGDFLDKIMNKGMGVGAIIGTVIGLMIGIGKHLSVGDRALETFAGSLIGAAVGAIATFFGLVAMAFFFSCSSNKDK